MKKITVKGVDHLGDRVGQGSKSSERRHVSRLRVVSNFGDGDCWAGEIHTHARKFEGTRREGSSSKFCARVCISSTPQSPSPKLETTRSLACQKNDLKRMKRVPNKESTNHLAAVLRGGVGGDLL